MPKLNRITLYLFLSTLSSSIVTGQGLDGSELPGGVVIQFVDDLVVSQVSTWNDLVLFVLLPLIGIYAILHFIIHHAFKLAEGNFNDNTGYGSSSMSDTGEQAAKWVAAAAAVITTMFYGGFTGVVITIIGFIAILWFLWMVWKALASTGGGINIPNPFSPSDTPDVDYPDSIPVDAPDSISIDRPDWLDELSGDGGDGGGHPFINMMQQQMQQQQMQMSPAMLQFMGLMYGMVQAGNGGAVEVRPVNGNGPSAEVSVEVANELNNLIENLNQNMISQQMVNSILNHLQQQQQMNNQTIQQLIAIIRNGAGGGPGREGNGPDVNVDVDVDLKNIINQVQQNQTVQNVYQQVQQAQFINQALKEELLALLTGDVHQESRDVYVIQVPDGRPVEVSRDLIIKFYQLITSLQAQQVNLFMSRLEQLLRQLGRQQQLTNELLEELIVILRNLEGGEPEGGDTPPEEPDTRLHDQLIDDIQKLIEALRREEQVSEEVFQEKRDAERRLASALKELMNDHAGIFRALIYFRKVDIDAPNADIHQQVEKIMKNINEIGSADQLQREAEIAGQLMVKIEKALQEVRDADQKMVSELKFEQSSEAGLEEISRIVNELQKGETKVREYLTKYENM